MWILHQLFHCCRLSIIYCVHMPYDTIISAEMWLPVKRAHSGTMWPLLTVCCKQYRKRFFQVNCTHYINSKSKAQPSLFFWCEAEGFNMHLSTTGLTFFFFFFQRGDHPKLLEKVQHLHKVQDIITSTVIMISDNAVSLAEHASERTNAIAIRAATPFSFLSAVSANCSSSVLQIMHAMHSSHQN